MAQVPGGGKRWSALLVALVISWGLTSAGLLYLADRGQLVYVTSALDVVPWVDQRLASIRDRPAQQHRVLFLGDSLAMDVRGPDTSIPSRLGQALAESAPGEPAIELAIVTGPGLSLYSHYFLSDCVIDLHPDQIVLALNLHSFSKRWRAEERFQLSGWIRSKRWPEALGLPLHTVGVSLDRLLFYRALVALGAFDAWHRLQREQVRLAWAYWEFADWLQAKLGPPKGLAFVLQHQQAELRRDKTSASRATRHAARAILGPVLDGLEADDPGIRVLDALLARFQEAGIPVLLYLAPTNVEHLESLGVYDRGGMARSIARIEAVSRRRGALLLDLHDLLPDAAFADHLDHLAQDVEGEGSYAVSERLAPVLRNRARR